MKFIVITAVCGLFFTVQTRAAETSTQMQMARVDDSSLTCTISETVQKPSEEGDGPFLANLKISGFSNAPAVWDTETNWWKKIKDEPLFIYGPSSGGDATELEVPLMLMHKVYVLPMLTNIGMASSAIGTMRDMPFSADYKLSYYLQGAIKPIRRKIKINYYTACTVQFSKDKKWSVVAE